MQKKGALQRYHDFWGYLLIAPQIVGLFVFMLFPMFMAVYLAFAQWDFFSFPQFVGLDNFRVIFQDSLLRTTLYNTVILTVAIMPLTLIASLSLALLVHHANKGTALYRLVVFLPMVTSTVAISLVWFWIYAPDYGVLNIVLQKLGLNAVRWLEYPAYARISLVIMCVWGGLGYNFLIFLAGLKAISQSYYEAARLDGASPWNLFKHVTWPLLSPTTFYISITTFLGVFTIFNQSYMLTGGGPQWSTTTMMLYMYNKAFKNLDMGVAAAIAMVIAFIQISVTILQFKGSKRWVNYDVE